MNLMQRGIAIAALVTVLSAVSVTGFSVTGLSVTGFGSGTVRAQTVDDGVVWAFAQEEPFVDERVATAFASLVDVELTATGAPAATAVRPEPDGGVVPLPGAPPEQAPLLFAAAGYPEAGFAVIGPCHYWAAAGTEDAGAKVAAAFNAVLADLGIDADPCALTADPAEAHLLVWAGETAPAIPSRGTPTFLTGSNVQLPPPPPQPGGTGSGGTGGAPQPPDTGMGRASAAGAGLLPVWGLVLLAGGLALAAHRATGRSRG